jgi:SAM-dependent methyltransferase
VPRVPKLEWTSVGSIPVGPFQVACAPGIKPELGSHAGWDQVAGIRTDTPRKRLIKAVTWPVVSLSNELLGNAYCHRGVGRWVRRNAGADTTFLEIGCGPLSLRKYLPRGAWYNGLDIAFSEFQVRRALRLPRVNLVLADAGAIPAPDDSVSLIGSCQAFMHMPHFDRVADELHRVCKPGARVACSISNYYCHKYSVLGPNSDIKQRWTYDEFPELMGRHGFRLLDRRMLGRWFRVGGRDYELPLASPDVRRNSNFLFLFEATK